MGVSSLGPSLGNLGERSVGQPGECSYTGDFEGWLNGALEVGHFYRSSVKGIWREDSLAGDPEGYIEKALDISISFIGALMGSLEGGS
jgi:hypothetical protein